MKRRLGKCRLPVLLTGHRVILRVGCSKTEGVRVPTTNISDGLEHVD